MANRIRRMSDSGGIGKWRRPRDPRWRWNAGELPQLTRPETSSSSRDCVPWFLCRPSPDHDKAALIGSPWISPLNPWGSVGYVSESGIFGTNVRHWHQEWSYLFLYSVSPARLPMPSSRMIPSSIPPAESSTPSRSSRPRNSSSPSDMSTGPVSDRTEGMEAPAPGFFQCGSCKRQYKRLDHLARHVRSRECRNPDGSGVFSPSCGSCLRNPRA